MIKPSICIVTLPISKSGLVPLSSLVDILYPLTTSLYLISGNAGFKFEKDKRVYFRGLIHIPGKNIFTRILNFVFTQIKISSHVINSRKKVDYFLFFLGGPTLLFPMIIAKIFGKSVIMNMSGSDIKSIKSESTFLSLLITIPVKINLKLSDKIVIYSKSLIKEYQIENHHEKIYVCPRHFIDNSKFNIETEYKFRDNIIGYIGRLNYEKGILNLLNSIPIIMEYFGSNENNNNVRFIIIGEGPLKSEIKDFLKKNHLEEIVELVEWVPHEEINKYLNKLKLLVLPSYTEGLPNIILESMASGTPVLATDVGSIKDILIDDFNGFLMKSNDPTSIAENIIRTLTSQDLSLKSANAYNLVINQFSYEKSLNNYKELLKRLIINNRH